MRWPIESITHPAGVAKLSSPAFELAGGGRTSPTGGVVPWTEAGAGIGSLAETRCGALESEHEAANRSTIPRSRTFMPGLYVNAWGSRESGERVTSEGFRAPRPREWLRRSGSCVPSERVQDEEQARPEQEPEDPLGALVIVVRPHGVASRVSRLGELGYARRSHGRRSIARWTYNAPTRFLADK